MRKRERENPCFICNHYHKFEEGEVCNVCGHRKEVSAERAAQQSAFSAEILPFLYLGSYDNASRSELLKAQGITHILNTVAGCQNLYKNSFTYYCLKDDSLPLGECLDFIEKSRQENAKVLVHCMSGQSRSPAVVIAYLMRYKGWTLRQSYEYVRERRPSIKLNPDVTEQLQQFESEIFRNNGQNFTMSPLPLPQGISFTIGNNMAVSVPGAGDQNMDGL